MTFRVSLFYRTGFVSAQKSPKLCVLRPSDGLDSRLRAVEAAEVDVRHCFTEGTPVLISAPALQPRVRKHTSGALIRRPQSLKGD